MYPQLCGFVGASILPEVCCPHEVATDNRVIPYPPGTPGQAHGLHDRGCRRSDKQKLRTHKPAGPRRDRRPGSIARQKCQEYVKYVCSEMPSPALMLGNMDVTDRCHYHVQLITGGKEANPMEFPHMVLLGYGDRKRPDFACGGSLISPNFVLTAAHCQVSRPSGLPVRWALMGTLQRSFTSHTNAKPQLLDVVDVILHPDYRDHMRYHDIALLRLSRAAIMDDFVRPACLHTDKDREPNGDQSERLLKVHLPVIPMDRCWRAVNASLDRNAKLSLNRGIVDSQLCAGGHSVGDACQGDSGGPLQVPTNSDPYCQYKVVGVVSFGPPCGIGLPIPGVYTRVSTYVPWIETVVWPDETL